jgi:hypothetical protein
MKKSIGFWARTGYLRAAKGSRVSGRQEQASVASLLIRGENNPYFTQFVKNRVQKKYKT